jgi:hypothetical protein
MNTIEREVIIERDGEVLLHGIPCHKGDRVRAVIQVPDSNGKDHRQQARQRLLKLARSSPFTSQGLYPSRHELHERH